MQKHRISEIIENLITSTLKMDTLGNAIPLLITIDRAVFHRMEFATGNNSQLERDGESNQISKI